MEERHEKDFAPLFGRIRRLQLRSVRERSGFHFIEGFRNFIQASDAGIDFQTLVYSEILARNPAVQMNVRRMKRAGTPVLRVRPEEFRRLSSTERASGIGAVVRQHWTPLEHIDPRRGSCWIAFRFLRSPGNIGTILRTAEAVGAGGIIVLEERVDLFDPAVVRASMGGIFRLQLARASLSEFSHWARERGCRVLGTSPSAPTLHTEVDVDPPLVILFGDERKGLRPEELAVCTHSARIPILGRADSLNVGVAAGVMLYEVLRRRNLSGPT